MPAIIRALAALGRPFGVALYPYHVVTTPRLAFPGVLFGAQGALPAKAYAYGIRRGVLRGGRHETQRASECPPAVLDGDDGASLVFPPGDSGGYIRLAG